MKLESFLIGLGFSGLVGIASSADSKLRLRVWLQEMHAKQIELLNIDWGQPGFCTKWDRDYDEKALACGRRGRLTTRK